MFSDNRALAAGCRWVLLALVLFLAGRSMTLAMEHVWVEHVADSAAATAQLVLRMAGVIGLVAVIELLHLPRLWLLLAVPPALLPVVKWQWGPIYVVLVLLAATAALRRQQMPAWLCFAVAAVALVPWLMLLGAWGDEWEYLANLDSLATDGDLNVVNQLATQDYLRFGRHQPLLPWFGPGEQYGLTPHVLTFGYLATLLPGWLLLGRYGVHLIQVAAALALWPLLLLLANSFSLRCSPLAALLVLGTLPVWPYVVHIYPELMAASLLVLVVLRLWAGESGLLTGALAGLLPWLNLRYLLLLAPLMVVAWWCRRMAARRMLLAAAGMVAVLLLLQSPYYPLLSDAGKEREYFSWVLHTGLLGNLFDGEYGVLPYAPLWLWAVVGALRLWHGQRTRVLQLALLVLPYFLVMSSYEAFWYGGQAAPARFMVVLMPLLFPLLLAGIPPADSGWCRRLWQGAVVWSGGCALALTLVPVWQLNVRLDGKNQILAAVEHLLGVPVSMLLPSWRLISPVTWWLTLGYAILAMMIVTVCWRRYGRNPAA
ncbi:MAG TPA: hypothetical protein PKM88_02725 [bacterium]|nr:hypothetical protein [bacterium]